MFGVRAAIAAALIACAAWTCASTGDRLLLERFFFTSRLRDRTALARLATVVFEPNVDGMVVRFDIETSTRARAGGSSGLDDRDARRLAELSLANPLDPIDVTHTVLRFSERDVTVRADVRLPDGLPGSRTITVTLRRASVSAPLRREGRWIVTGFR
jgi:hypothetical protein